MMEGINILEQTEIYAYPPIYSKIIITLIIIAIIALVTAIIIQNDIVFVIFGIMIMLVILMITFSRFFETGTGEYEYKVTINDNVSLTKFNETYDIIEHQDNSKIYTIKRRCKK